MSALATMEAFEKLLNESLDSSTPKEGEVVNGSVIAIEAGQAIIDIGSVSYTHLTLPTKRIV